MGVYGIAFGDWNKPAKLYYLDDTSELAQAHTKPGLLSLWDKVADDINKTWPGISEARFQQEEVVFGQYEGTIWSHIFYFIDNEIHHRGQGYVYLRSLGIEPPYFWER